MHFNFRTEAFWVGTMLFLFCNALARAGFIHASQEALDAYMFGFVGALGLGLWQISNEIEREKRRTDKITDRIYTVLSDHERSLRK